MKVLNENALVPVRLMISHCEAEFTTVRVVNENALVTVRLHISFRTDITLYR